MKPISFSISPEKVIRSPQLPPIIANGLEMAILGDKTLWNEICLMRLYFVYISIVILHRRI